MSILQRGIDVVERGLVPDRVTRMAIRRLCRGRLRMSEVESSEAHAAFQASLREGPVALVPEKANEQHYEVPSPFFQAVLGPRMKYSCCYFPDADTTLAEAEEAALKITCERAELTDGQEVIELGCGWGSLSLWMAEKYPHSRITAVSNSSTQRQFIQARAAELGLNNLTVITADMNDFSPGEQRFDRVVSVEMFEHMRNFDLLLSRIASWLNPGGKLFVHIFCHRVHAYNFDTEGASDWMGRYFFTGGIMPSADLLKQFGDRMKVTKHFMWNGSHYHRTSEAWLQNLDRNRDAVIRAFTPLYGASEARRWLHRWRMFFLAVAELFGYENGEEWYVSHYLMEPTR